MARKINRDYSIDYVHGIVRVARDFERRAGQIGSSEYNELMRLRKDHPGMTVERKTINRKRPGQIRISYVAMETYIGCLQNKEKWFQDYQTVRKMSAVQKSPYNFVRKWFQDTFPDFRKSPVFDQEGHAVVTVGEEYIMKDEPNDFKAA